MLIRFLVVSWCLIGGGLASAGDWAHWRGPEQNGISRETGLVSDWSLDDKTNVVWVSPIGGRATPIVLNGRIYLNCRTPDDVNDPQQKVNAREQVVCRDANTGDVIWKDVFNVFQTDIPAPRVGWAAMVGDEETGNVYVHSVSGIFRCYDRDGNVVWEHSLFEDFGKISGYGGRTQTPIIDEDRIIVSFLCMNWGKTGTPPPKQTYYAFDKRTGKLLWISAPGGRPYDTNYSCPVVAVINGIRMLIGGNSDGGIHAMNARTGEHIWSFRMSKRGLNVTPVVDGKHVYIAHGEDNIDSVTFGRIQCIDATGRGDVTETHGVWRVNDIKAGYTGLLIKDGVLYVVADTGNLHAFDSQSGEALWIHDLGTVGKGSPVWADGKIYVMEVNGNIHILKPSREGCESLSHVRLEGVVGEGPDEIYASPAIASGRVYFVTRDRTICIGGKEPLSTSDEIPALAEERPAEDEIATIQLVPYETYVMGSGRVEYELRAFDRNGRFVRKLDPQIEAAASLADVKSDGSTVVVGTAATEQAGLLTAKHNDLAAQARLRVFPPLPWSWDFEQSSSPPATWVDAVSKLKPVDMDGNTVLLKAVPRGGRPSAFIRLGPAEMRDYTIQADVMMKEQRRRLPSVGITAQRYNLIIKGNVSKLAVQSWAPHLRMAKEIRYRSDPDVWYTMKLRVDVQDDGAHVMGKVWKRDEPEPSEWTIEALDPHPNENGSPGFYVYSLADCYFDNVSVTKE